MACCGKKTRIPYISPEQQKIIEKVQKTNFGAVKRGKPRVTATSKKCINCNTIVTGRQVCPICGYKL